jgi:FimV-like protein
VKNEGIALAVCFAIAGPTIAVAETFTGIAAMNLGDINSRSFLDEHFTASIPILYTTAKEALEFKARLAPDSVFDDLGVEKLPALKSLHFEVKIRSGKPYVAIRSSKTIDLPFLSFVVEVYSPEGSIYQDYTVLLDPRHYSAKNTSTNVEVSTNIIPNISDSVVVPSVTVKTNRPKRLRVTAGDTVSNIANTVKLDDISNKNMSLAIFLKNPRAFSGNNVNKLKKGVTLTIPTLNEVNKLVQRKPLYAKTIKPLKKPTSPKPSIEKEVNTKLKTTLNEQKPLTTSYKVKSGDSLSAIARKYASKSVSFSTMMANIHSANPHAFTNNKVSLLKKGVTLSIPLKGSYKKTVMVTPDKVAQSNTLFKNYTVKKGDNLSAIVHKHGYEGSAANSIMKSLFADNPNAFEKDNITILKAGAKLRIPVQNSLKNSTTKSLLTKPDSTLETAINLSLNSLEKRLREIRKALKSTKSELFDLKLTLKNKDILLERQSKDIKILKKRLLKSKNTEQSNIVGEAVSELSEPIQQNLTEKENSDNKLSVAELVTYSGLAMLMG